MLTYLGVAAVVCLGECDGSAAAGLEERGLDVHHLGLDPRQPSMLQVMDWVLAVAREAPGAVAVCSGEGCWGGEWREVVGTLAAAYLMGELGFDAGPAEALIARAEAAALGPVPAMTRAGALLAVRSTARRRAESGGALLAVIGTLRVEWALVVSVVRAAAAAMKSQTIRTLCTNRDRDRKDF